MTIRKYRTSYFHIKQQRISWLARKQQVKHYWFLVLVGGASRFGGWAVTLKKAEKKQVHERMANFSKRSLFYAKCYLNGNVKWSLRANLSLKTCGFIHARSTF